MWFTPRGVRQPRMGIHITVNLVTGISQTTHEPAAHSTISTVPPSFMTTSVDSRSSLNPTPTSSNSSPGSGRLSRAGNTVCLGNGLDASVDGLLTTIVLFGLIGLLLWLLFALIRPHFRQIYGLREWFVQERLRPTPLRPTFWAFLNPPVPMVPSISNVPSDPADPAAEDPRSFPSDEELSQRTLWFCFSCILRILQLLDDRDRARSGNGQDLKWRGRLRVIILTGLLIVLGLVPALIKILHEYGKLVAFRRKWTDVHLHGKELGWISTRDAPGFVSWGEKRLKDFILKTGLSSSLDFSAEPANSGTGRRGRSTRNVPGSPYMHSDEHLGFEVDILSLFTIIDTHRLALLIEERDVILEQLEIAETKYISSFRITTPEPSIADLNPAPTSDTEGITYISRPRMLSGSSDFPQTGRRRRRGRNPADASSSLSPTSYLAPSTYYKLGIRGINGGRFADDDARTSFTDSVHQRIVGTRFQEVNRSGAFNRFPIGNLFRSTASGVLDEVPEPQPEPEPDAPIPDPMVYGPNYVARVTEDTTDPATLYSPGSGPTHLPSSTGEDDWVDVGREPPIDFRYTHTPSTPSPMTMPNPARASSIFRFVRRPKIFGPAPSEHRSTFPLRQRMGSESGGGSGHGEEVPPHLRVQRTPPFVRPLTGLNHDELGSVYSEIRTWRTRLKSINEDIRIAQEDGYQAIADGALVKGWLLTGRGLRFLPGIQLIEGRAKEDVRWDILQLGRGDTTGQFAFWTIVLVNAGTLLLGLIAAAGLAVATSPDYAHYLPFFQSMANDNGFSTGLATVLAPSVAATLFILLAILALHLSARLVGTISVAAGQRIVIKAMFYMIVFIAVIGLVAAGALLYAFDALSRGTRVSKTVADGSVNIAILLLAIVINIAITSPALLMLQPLRLRRILHAERVAKTPRQRFRATYPRTYNPLFAMACCILAFTFASTFAMIFPLIGPPVVVLILLTLVAHRFLIGYVYGRTRSQTGGLLQIWLLKRFASLLALQPILLGLILLSRRLWPEGSTLVATGIVTIFFVEVYTRLKERQPGRGALSPVSQHALESFRKAARPSRLTIPEEESTSIVSSGRAARTRGSFASVLDMMSMTLAVVPSQYQQHGPVPIPTETLDDLTATERAARTHPDAPPRLPPLPFTDHAEEMSRICTDLEKYHELKAVIEVRSNDDAILRRHHLNGTS
ncbi:hypothetical protein BC826DRAFT_1090413 [Russula brevipes]|nr:hypothetical protein BC826DRAFT_1090413 [Russula brevipes]